MYKRQVKNGSLQSVLDAALQGKGITYKIEDNICLLYTSTLVEGEVEVKDKSDKGRITLLPGQKAVLNRVTGRMQVKPVSYTHLDEFGHCMLFRIFAHVKALQGDT